MLAARVSISPPAWGVRRALRGDFFSLLSGTSMMSPFW
jgi:hypothetical protein